MRKLERKTAEAYATLFRENLFFLPSHSFFADPPSSRAQGQRLVANKSADPARVAGTIPSGQDLVASMDAAERERRRREGAAEGLSLIHI